MSGSSRGGSRHRLIVAGGFRFAGVLLGAPALIAALYFGWSAVALSQAPKPGPSQMLDVSTYGLVGLLSNAATGVGAGLSLFNGIVAGIVAMAAVLAILATLFAFLLYLVGRGLKRARGWARAIAFVVAGFGLLVGAGAFLATTDAVRAAVAGVLAVDLYALWVLGWRFGPGADPGAAEK
jgi:hypothetical protein